MVGDPEIIKLVLVKNFPNYMDRPVRTAYLKLKNADKQTEKPCLNMVKLFELIIMIYTMFVWTILNALI